MDGVSRRGFFSIAAAVLFGLRSEPLPIADPVPPSAADPAEVDRLRRVLIPPDWTTEPRVTLLWVERTPDGDGCEQMIWTPETPAEMAAAERFHSAAAYRSWRTEDELYGLLLDGGEWVVRLNANGRMLMLTTADEARACPPDDSDEEEQLLTDDPRAAARMDAVTAARLVLRLTDDWGLADAPLPILFEPVRPADAGRDRRLDFLIPGGPAQ